MSKAMIKRVNAIIEDLGYVPNMSARALASRSSKVVAMVNHLDPAVSGNFMEDPFHTAFIGAVETALRESSYYLMMRSVGSSADLREFLSNWNVDGLFLTGVFEDEDLYEGLRGLRAPVVLCDSYLSDYSHVVNVGLQDYEGGRLATEHLLQNGHKQIAFVGPPINHAGVVEQRLLGYRSALAAAGVPFAPSRVFDCEFSPGKTMRLGKELAARDDITAIFCTADVLAAGIIAGIQQAGKRVPEEFSLVGFDDIAWCRMLNPPLTTIHQDAAKKGETAAKCMVTLLEGGEVPERNIILPVNLIARASVCAI
ncbi:LacI family transcriptional regulator [Clostridia bacterium]|nr:LacI family transcriptional regulator [Clostridia bacterium]